MNDEYTFETISVGVKTEPIDVKTEPIDVYFFVLRPDKMYLNKANDIVRDKGLTFSEEPQGTWTITNDVEDGIAAIIFAFNDIEYGELGNNCGTHIFFQFDTTSSSSSSSFCNFFTWPQHKKSCKKSMLKLSPTNEISISSFCEQSSVVVNTELAPSSHNILIK